MKYFVQREIGKNYQHLTKPLIFVCILTNRAVPVAYQWVIYEMF